MLGQIGRPISVPNRLVLSAKRGSHFLRPGRQGIATGFETKLLSGLLLSAVIVTTLRARTQDLSKLENALVVSRKIICGWSEDDKVRFGTWSGRAYGRVPWAKDRYRFKVIGTNVRQCGTVIDPERGVGYRSVSREIMLYVDLTTNVVLGDWTNPYTKQKMWSFI